MHILIKVILLTVSFNQLRASPVKDLILPKILQDETLASCKPFNSFLDSSNEYLQACNISSSKLTKFNSFNLAQLLCLSFYDINLRMCEMKNKYPKLALPTNVSQVVEILNNFDQDPSIAREFCSKSPEQVSYGNNTKLLNYAVEFNDTFNDTMSCNVMCIGQIVPKKYTINPFCKIFLWGNLQLKAANAYLDNLAKTTQQTKTSENNSSKKLEPQPVNVSNETISGTGERPQVVDVISQGTAVANVTNVPSTTSDNVVINSVKPVEPEKVVPGSMAVENPPIAPQEPVIADSKPDNANSNNPADGMVDSENDDYDNEAENEIGNSGLDDPVPQNPNESNEMPIQLEHVHKSSLSSEKADKEIVFEKNFDTNPKMVITEGQFIEAENGHFFPFFLSAVALSVLAYVLLHNKKKVMALLIEGRQGNGGGRRRNSRGHAYRRLDTLEQAISSKSQTAPPTNIIY